MNISLKGRRLTTPTVTTLNPDKPESSLFFANTLVRLLDELSTRFAQLVVLCIGSDRCTGDSLGPLAGSVLEDLNPRGCTVFGTVKQPVHALNLAQTIEQIDREFYFPCILAVDACLGRKEKVGLLEIGRGSLNPGAGVKKELPPVGDIFITGIVNVGGAMEFMVLQNTRLGVVIPMANFIAKGIFEALSKSSWGRTYQ